MSESVQLSAELTAKYADWFKDLVAEWEKQRPAEVEDSDDRRFLIFAATFMGLELVALHSQYMSTLDIDAGFSGAIDFFSRRHATDFVPDKTEMQ